jgi:hypothetical protein
MMPLDHGRHERWQVGMAALHVASLVPPELAGQGVSPGEYMRRLPEVKHVGLHRGRGRGWEGVLWEGGTLGWLGRLSVVQDWLLLHGALGWQRNAGLLWMPSRR